MARGRTKILEALAWIGNSELRPEDILDFSKEVGAIDNNRSAAILLGTHLEGVLQFALINRLKDGRTYSDTMLQWVLLIEKSASPTL
jgi:hypothetical protein